VSKVVQTRTRTIVNLSNKANGHLETAETIGEVRQMSIIHFTVKPSLTKRMSPISHGAHNSRGKMRAGRYRPRRGRSK